MSAATKNAHDWHCEEHGTYGWRGQVCPLCSVATSTLQITAARVENNTPVSYRLARKTDGELILQGAFKWSEGCNGGIEWRDIPTFELAQWQYYRWTNGCPAETANHSGCTCWHDEGTGPLSKLRHDVDTDYEWRSKSPLDSASASC